MLKQLKFKVQGLAEAEYKLTVYDSGDLLESSWAHALTNGVADFEKPNTLTDLSNQELKLSGAQSIVGLGVAISARGVTAGSAALARGVVGINSAGANTQRTAKWASCRLQTIAKSPMNVTGSVSFRRLEDNSMMRIRAQVVGLADSAMYGIHIHEIGNLGSNDGLSTKGHYNPKSTTHKLPGGAEAGHVGDLGNIAYYDNAGVAWYEEANMSAVELAGSAVNVLGRAIVVHSQMDNGCEQPTGGAGSRLAFCVIGLASQEQVPKTPFFIPTQRGSTGCNLENTPTTIPRSASFVWVTVIICLSLAGIGGLFAYNWWRARNNPATPAAANGRQPWYAHQNEDEA